METMGWRGKFAAAVAAILLVAGFALAAAFQENFAEIKKPTSGGVPTFLSGLSGLSGNDSTTWNATTPIAGRCFPTQGDGTLEVIVRHSAPGSTAMIAVCRRDKNNGLQGAASVQTSTAFSGDHAVFDGTGYYGEPLYFATLGWAKFETRVYDVSGSGTVDLKPVMTGAAGAAAE